MIGCLELSWPCDEKAVALEGVDKKVDALEGVDKKSCCSWSWKSIKKFFIKKVRTKLAKGEKKENIQVT